MPNHIVEISDDFWNVRGSYKVRGLLELGTQCSLVRLKDGRFVLLDSYTLSGQVEERIRARTDGGRAIAAVLNLHPFHTIHVKKVHEQLPDAKLYGTARHKARAPELPWEEELTESPELHALFADDFAFSVPRGVDFVPANENLHFASVLALHKPSRTLHVDDTLMYLTLPLMTGLGLHPTLKKVLQPRPGAVAEFRAWGDELVALCEGADRIVTAHGPKLAPTPPAGTTLADQVRVALGKVEGILDKHEKKWG